MTFHIPKTTIISATFFIIGVLLGILLVYWNVVSLQSPINPPAVSNPAMYSYLNRTVTVDATKHFIINFAPLKNSLAAVQKKYSQSTYIYFDYLNNASWVGLGERDMFTAASTIKVPLAMAVYRSIEEGKLKPSDAYTLQTSDLDSNFGNLYKVGAGKTYTVEELVKIMLEYSDNTAMNALYSVMSNIGISNPLDDVYTFMGWDNNYLGQDSNVQYQNINVKTLSNMLIALYNAKYDNAADSNQILYYLDESPFNDKIVNGVPEDIAVAHKIGISDENNTFSDCGIVYAPNRNYLLCLGSSGADEKTADAFMTDVSKKVYDYVINN